MMSYRESQNFLWYTSESDELGRGSFGTVYRGMHKVTGEPVAVKVPHSHIAIAEEIERREIEVCQRINHVNIVKLLGYEEVREGRGNGMRRERPRRIFVMELCDGGSLLKVLENPMNHFGLEEDEFLTVLRDITAGMKYLRETGIIHRDLKPANIMRCISDDGTSIYKITDFGAARELAENQEYSSIFGTEEYLDPDVYEQALLPEIAIPNRRFSPSTDLWSIGATLFHVATGFLPFRPRDGRKNKKVMHAMTTKKESGVISAVQDADNRIIFCKKLPKNCLLSPDLKDLLCPLLAGLMEAIPQKKISFEYYFHNVEEILQRKQLHLFYINNLRLIRLYINPVVTKTYKDLTDLIHSQTHILPADQILLFRDSTLETVLEMEANDTNICSKLPMTSKHEPVILCNRSDTEVTREAETFTLNSKQFPNMIDYRKDAEIAIHNCSVSHHYKRLIQEVCLKVRLIYSSVQTINQVVVTQLTAASKENILIRRTVHSMRNQFEMMRGFHSLCESFAKLVPEDIGTNNNGITFHEGVKQFGDIYAVKYNEFQKLERMLAALKPSIDALLGSRIQNRFLMSSWEQESGQVKGVDDFIRVEKISSTLVAAISQSYAEISGDMPSSPQRRRTPEPDEECLHLIERTKMVQTIDKLKRLLTECTSNYETLLTKVLGEWYKKALTAFIQPEILAKDIKRLQKEIADAETELSECVQGFKGQLELVTDSLSAFPVMTGSMQNSQNRKESAKAIRQRLHELAQVQQELQSNFQINAQLCNQLQGLLMNSMDEA